MVEQAPDQAELARIEAAPPWEEGSSGGDNTDFYHAEISRIPLLTADQEVALAQTLATGREAQRQLQISKGDLAPEKKSQLEELIRKAGQARQTFIEANLRLVVSCANKYLDSPLPILDRIQVGNIGLMRAVEKYDPSRGFRFSTYAYWWIRQAIVRTINDHKRIIRIPIHMQELASKLLPAAHQLLETNSKEPTPEELADYLGVSVEQVRLAKTALDPILSLDMPPEDGDETLGSFILSPEPSVEDQTTTEEFTRTIREAVGKLNPTERTVIVLRFGLGDDGVARSLREVGGVLGVSRERVRQIQQRALEKLRSPHVRAAIQDYM